MPNKGSRLPCAHSNARAERCLMPSESRPLSDVRCWPTAEISHRKQAARKQTLLLELGEARLAPDYCLFPSRVHKGCHLGTRQHARILDGWVHKLGLDPCSYGTHSIRRTKATLIYRKTRNLRAVQLLLGHTKLGSTVRYLGIEVDDAMEIAEQIEV